MVTPNQPKITLKTEPADKLLDFILLLSLSVIVAVPVLGYIILPDEIPFKYNADGDAVAYGGKLSLLALPAIGILLAFALRWLKNYPHIFNYPYKITEQNIELQYRLAQRMVMAINIVETWLFAYHAIAGLISAVQQHSVADMSIAAGFVVLIFVVIVFYFRKAKALR